MYKQIENFLFEPGMQGKSSQVVNNRPGKQWRPGWMGWWPEDRPHSYKVACIVMQYNLS